MSCHFSLVSLETAVLQRVCTEDVERSIGAASAATLQQTEIDKTWVHLDL